MSKHITAALGAAVLALALAACGSSDSSSNASVGGTGTPGGSSTTPRGDLQSAEVQKCLKEQGVELPNLPEGGQPPDGGGYGGPPQGGLPGGGGGGAGMTDAQGEKMQKAFETCGVQFGQGQGGQGQGANGPNTNSAAYRKQVEAYAACVRKNGFELPDPDFSGDGPVFDPDEVDQGDPKFQAASEACQSELRPAA